MNRIYARDKIPDMPVDPVHLARLLKQVELILPRLEKLSPDLKAAHRASGVRRTLLRFSSEYPPEALDERDIGTLEISLERGFRMLSDAARARFV